MGCIWDCCACRHLRPVEYGAGHHLAIACAARFETLALCFIMCTRLVHSTSSTYQAGHTGEVLEVINFCLRASSSLHTLKHCCWPKFRALVHVQCMCISSSLVLVLRTMHVMLTQSCTRPPTGLKSVTLVVFVPPRAQACNAGMLHVDKASLASTRSQ